MDNALAALPKIAASMARGELSYSKVRTLTRIASDATEDGLLMIALHGTAHHVERLVRHYRRAEHAEELQREDRQAERCRLNCWHDSDGSLVFHGRMPAVAGTAFLKALDAAMEAVPATEPTSPAKYPFDWDDSDEQSDVLRPYGERRADALAMIAESFLEHGPTLSVETARRLSCDASVVAVVENDNGEPLSVGRMTRIIPPALRRALNTRDEGCRFPGCTYHQYVDAHHVQHWTDGGETKLSNLIILCRAHRKDPQAFQWDDILRVNEAKGFYVDPRTAATRWLGERMDYDLALFCLFNQRDRRRAGVSAETLECDM